MEGAGAKSSKAGHRVAAEMGGAFVVALLTVPTIVPRTLTLLDGSWILANSLSRPLGLQWGRDLAFTYGPLGFLKSPVPVTDGVVIGGLLFWLGSFTLLAWATVQLAKTLGSWGAWGLAFVSASLCGTNSEVVAPLVVVVLWSFLLLREELTVPARLVWWSMGAASGLLVLVKFNAGVVAIAWLGCVALARPRRINNVLTLAASASAAFLTAWVMFGQSLRLLPAYALDSIEISLGYGHAMGQDMVNPNGLVILAMGLGLAAAALAFTWKSLDRSTSVARFFVLAGMVTVLISAWLQAFVRFDPGHATLFFTTVGPIVIALAGAISGSLNGSGRRFVLVGSAVGLACIGMLTASGSGAPRSWTEVAHPQASLASTTEAVVLGFNGGSRRVVLTSLRAGFLAQAGLPQAIRAQVPGSRMHAEPWALGAVWAAGGMWTPVPVYQTYSAYTEHLDEINARAAVSGRAPQRVLRQNSAIDHRNPLWESPRLQMVYMCSYRESVAAAALQGPDQTGQEAVAAAPWQVLERADNRCAEPAVIGQRRIAGGLDVRVPSWQGIVAADVRESAGGQGRLRIKCNATTWELAQSAPTGPLIMSVPTDVGWSEGTFPESCQTVQFDRDVSVTWTGTRLVS